MNGGRPALSVRPDLVDVAPYVSPQRPARYRMNTNETPFPPPETLVKEVAAEIEAISLNRYPDRDATRLLDAISDHVGWPKDGLWVANGSNEVFMHLFLAFGGPGRRSLTFEPTYSLHTLIPRISGTETFQCPRGDEFEIDVDEAVETIKLRRPDVVIACSPNNPTGDCEPVSTIEALLDVAPGIVVVDEAYGEFDMHDHSVVSLLPDNPKLVITKTFSKAWRLAGVRIGYMLADPTLVAELARVRLPYHLSAITQVIGEAAIRHAEETLTLVKSICDQRDRITFELQSLVVKTYPSSANFVLF
ncbi:MAG TPA: aminotransferase class I/II-fold pyridoxal phosphate-dependent enzyme, partial [Actinomycetota bacterium]|nr:aminotransferase class I/II-fold pyridoxal phosphate-dependent enzyme [Actinomycetota bacterium]